MTRKITKIFVVALAIGTAAAWSTGPALAKGALKFCRKQDLVPGVQKVVNGERVRLPANAAFEDFGTETDIAAAYEREKRWPLEIRLLKSLDLRPGQVCATIPAGIAPESKIRRVSPADKRHLEFRGFIKPDGSDDTEFKAPNSERIFDLDISVASPIG
jgi:hypothetical protein